MCFLQKSFLSVEIFMVETASRSHPNSHRFAMFLSYPHCSKCNRGWPGRFLEEVKWGPEQWVSWQ